MADPVTLSAIGVAGAAVLALSPLVKKGITKSMSTNFGTNTGYGDGGKLEALRVGPEGKPVRVSLETRIDRCRVGPHEQLVEIPVLSDFWKEENDHQHKKHHIGKGPNSLDPEYKAGWCIWWCDNAASDEAMTKNTNIPKEFREVIEPCPAHGDMFYHRVDEDEAKSLSCWE
ncbi:hypothetical protein F5Y18DRAFT_429529 [Xylariaceae sp. FL1019]|nr:hypothetical protein F5Y18DRAFT_429529 [Xylariaceae sp. FL1019]